VCPTAAAAAAADNDDNGDVSDITITSKFIIKRKIYQNFKKWSRDPGLSSKG